MRRPARTFGARPTPSEPGPHLQGPRAGPRESLLALRGAGQWRGSPAFVLPPPVSRPAAGRDAVGARGRGGGSPRRRSAIAARDRAPSPPPSPDTWQRRRAALPRLAVPGQKSGQGGRRRRAALTAGVAMSGAGLQRGGARCPSACSEPRSSSPSLTRISSVTKPAAVRWLCPQRASSVR